MDRHKVKGILIIVSGFAGLLVLLYMISLLWLSIWGRTPYEITADSLLLQGGWKMKIQTELPVFFVSHGKSPYSILFNGQKIDSKEVMGLDKKIDNRIVMWVGSDEIELPDDTGTLEIYVGTNRDGVGYGEGVFHMDTRPVGLPPLLRGALDIMVKLILGILLLGMILLLLGMAYAFSPRP